MLTTGVSYLPSLSLIEGTAEVLWKEVDEGWVRYDPSAGETFLLAPISRFVLEQIGASRQPVAVEALIAAVQQEEPEASSEECRLAVSAALDALLTVRLICPAPSPNLESQ